VRLVITGYIIHISFQEKIQNTPLLRTTMNVLNLGKNDTEKNVTVKIDTGKKRHGKKRQKCFFFI